jgi:hypothetical protein
LLCLFESRTLQIQNAASLPSGCIDLDQSVRKKEPIFMVLPHRISELPNSDPEIRSIKQYKSTLVEEVILIRIVKTLVILRP